MVEDVAVSPDLRSVVYSANTGSTPGDDDRRHVFRVDLSSASITPLTGGESSEWQPVALADDAAAFDRATAQQPPLLTMLSSGGAQRVLDAGMLPSDFPSSQLVTPREVSFHAADGWLIHGQLFLPRGGGKHPAVVFVHGGPERQMLLTWHYMDYYSNAYAVNQVLASRGFVVLSVNYRTGIGYGHDFNFPARWGPTGASEYQDVVAGARFLQHDARVDPKRIGIWGGSYGGYLTALALARNSDIFKAGVDFHGVHDWSFDIDNPLWGFTQLEALSTIRHESDHEARLGIVTRLRDRNLEIAGLADPRRRRPQRRVPSNGGLGRAPSPRARALRADRHPQ